MALLHNTVIQSATLGRRMAGLEAPLPLTGLVRAEKRNFMIGDHTPDKKEGYLSGLRPPQTWSMAMKDGSMSSRFSATMTFTPTATGQSIFNMTGSTDMTFDATAPFLEASFPGTGTASFSITASATAMKGIGQMTGTTVESTVVTNASIAAAVLAAAASTPIAANVKQVNDVTVTGTGATGDEWGP